MYNFRRLIKKIRSNRKAQIITITSAVSVLLLTGIALAVVPHIGNKNSGTASDISGSDFTYITPTLENNDTITDAPEPVVDDEVTSFVPATEIDLDPTSITVYVNKEYALPEDYKPDNLVTPNIQFDIQTYDERTLMRSEAAKAIEKLFAAAEKEGCYLSGVSGYRSYARQYKIFTNNIATQGKEHTLKYSAVPGTSEHQIGLVMDVSTKSFHYKLDDGFYDTPEGKWLAKNSYKYGFIIRYPKDKVDITGYAYEPWHIRYVGRGLSYYLYNNKLSLDEYYNYTPSPNFDFEEVYSDIINYVPPTRPVIATPTITPTVEPTKKPEKDTKPGDKNDTDPGDDTEDPDNLDATPVPTPSTGSDIPDDVTVTEPPTDDSTDDDNSNGDEDSDTPGNTDNTHK